MGDVEFLGNIYIERYGRLLMRERKKAGLDIEAAAELTGIELADLIEIEIGKKKIGRAEYARIRDIYKRRPH